MIQCALRTEFSNASACFGAFSLGVNFNRIVRCCLKRELTKQKKKLQGDNAATSRTKVNTWLNKIIDERSELERKF